MPLGLKVPKLSSQLGTTPASSGPTESRNIEDIDEVDDQGQSILMGIILQLRPGMDLLRITFPTFILERKLMLERITNQLQQPDLVMAAHGSKDPIERFLGVVRWYLSGWHIAPKAVKKPLNPVLGEHFTAYWELPNGKKAFYILEQTCHHPPKLLYFYMIPEEHIRVDGTAIPKSRFLGNLTAAMMEGVSVLQFLDIKDENGVPEKYTLTQPNMYARGILFGKLKLELGDHMVVTCESTGLTADIEFVTKGFILGTYDAIRGTVKKGNTTLYEILGKWNDKMYLKEAGSKKPSLFLDVHAMTPLPPKVRPVEEQGEFESRRLWLKVTAALGERNHEVATEEKFQIENHQRELAKKRVEDGVEFHPKLFRKTANYDPLDRNQVEFVLYKNLPDTLSPQQATEAILSVAPILPGQKFSEEFSIPAFQKLKAESETATKTDSAPRPVPGYS